MVPGVVNRIQVAQVNANGAASQGGRCSEDFTFTLPDGTFVLQYGVGGGDAATVQFDVMQDLGGGGADKPVTVGFNGSYSSVWRYPDGGSFYIANPRNNPSGAGFNVQLFAILLAP